MTAAGTAVRTGERESFRAAQRRHRLSARLYSVPALAAAVASSVPYVIVLLPPSFGLVVLAADLLNLARPTPDLARGVIDAIGRHEDGYVGGAVAVARGWPLPAQLGLLLPAPVSLVLAWCLCRGRMLRHAPAAMAVRAGARPADRTDLAEHRFANVVEETAVAAGVRPPRVLVHDVEDDQAAALGSGPDGGVVLVTRGLLDDLDRDAAQGVAAHLVASISHDDVRMQRSFLAVFLAQTLVLDVLTAPISRLARQRLRLTAAMVRGRDEEAAAEGLPALLDSEGDAFSTGYAMLVRVFAGIFVTPFLTPPLRARRHLADATAVRLTRDPDGIARALVHLGEHASDPTGARHVGIFAISRESGGRESAVAHDLMLISALHPSARRRVRRLRRLGATTPLPPVPEAKPGRRARPSWFERRSKPVQALCVALYAVPLLVVLLPLLAALLVGGLVYMVVLTGFSMAILTIVAVTPLHLLLRALAG